MRRVRVGNISLDEHQYDGTLRLAIGAVDGQQWSGNSITLQKDDRNDLLLAVMAFFGREPSQPPRSES